MSALPGKPSYAMVAVAAILLVLPVLSTVASRPAPPAPEPPAVTLRAARPDPPSAATPTSTLLVSDPVLAPHRITRQLTRLIESVPAGESIEVATYFLGSRSLERALVAAHGRGVRVRVLLEAHARPEHPESVRLQRLLDRDPEDGSWVRFSRGASRGPGGAMHQKTWRFSRAGDARFVTVTGSYNAGDLADSRAHSVMWQWVDPEVYRAFAATWAAQVRGVDQARPLRAVSGPGWSAYFSPLSSTAPAADPVLRRLAAIPATPGTVIRIAMYSMWDLRGDRIARRLADMARHGARIVLVAGPTVSYDVRAILRSGGVTVRPGCFADGTYTHSKDMSASYLAGGVRHYWTWVGSDNWTSDGMSSDEAVLGIESRSQHDLFGAYVRRLLTRTGGVYDAACRPRGGE